LRSASGRSSTAVARAHTHRLTTASRSSSRCAAAGASVQHSLQEGQPLQPQQPPARGAGATQPPARTAVRLQIATRICCAARSAAPLTALLSYHAPPAACYRTSCPSWQLAHSTWATTSGPSHSSCHTMCQAPSTTLQATQSECSVTCEVRSQLRLWVCSARTLQSSHLAVGGVLFTSTGCALSVAHIVVHIRYPAAALPLLKINTSVRIASVRPPSHVATVLCPTS
jgi:hypothetical protein